MRAFLALGGAVAALGAALLVWAIRQQVALSDCHVHCAGRSPWPVTAVGILLMLGGGFFTAWTAVAEHAGRVLHPLGHDLGGRPERLARDSVSRWSSRAADAEDRSEPVPTGERGPEAAAARMGRMGAEDPSVSPADPPERDRLRRVGRAGVARVLRATEAGTDPVGDPVVEVQLAVEVEGRAPYEVRQRTAVPRGRLDRLHAGRSLPVLVDPQDPERLVVEWA